MDSLTIIFIAIGLSMDAFAVSVSSGIIIKKEKVLKAIKIGFLFGLFQAIMPIIGWLFAFKLKYLITEIDHWIAFGLLSFIGCKMIYESFKKSDNDQLVENMNFYFFLLLALATSIDALIVGASFALLDISIFFPIIVIGLITFVFSFLGVLIGNKLGHFFENRIEIVGGIMLIGIGIKILFDHIKFI